MIIVGDIEDQLVTLIWSQISSRPFLFDIPSFESFFIYRFYFFNYLHPMLSSQPVLWTVVSLVMSMFGPNAYNILLVISVIANFLGSYFLFKRFRHGIIYSFLFTFSTFVSIHLGRHIDLMQIWLIPVFIALVLNWETGKYLAKSSIKLGLFLALAVLISNYIGFFLLIFFGLYFVLKALFTVLFGSRVSLNSIKGFVLSMGVVFMIVGGVLKSHILVNYSQSKQVSYPWKVSRNIDDFITFSSRPWYYVIPPVKNPFFGNISKDVITKIEGSRYFLADDYFPNEHQANYLGFSLYVSVLIFAVAIFVKGKKAEKVNLLIWLSVSLVIFSLSMPPYITLSGNTIFLPSYLIFKFFPMFRAIARLSVLLHALFLVILAMNFHAVYLMTSKKSQKALSMFIFVMAFLTFTETYVPLEFHKIEKVPEIYTALEKVEKNSSFVVFPHSRVNEAFLWLPTHKMNLVNIKGFGDEEFNSAEFTKNLPTLEGIKDLTDLDVDYFVLLKGYTDESVFLNSASFSLTTETDEGYLFEVLR